MLHLQIFEQLVLCEQVGIFSRLLVLFGLLRCLLVPQACRKEKCKKARKHSNFAPSKVIRIPESRKFLLVESRIRLLESRVLLKNESRIHLLKIHFKPHKRLSRAFMQPRPSYNADCRPRRPRRPCRPLCSLENFDRYSWRDTDKFIHDLLPNRLRY